MTYTPEMRAADAVIHNAIYGPWDETRCRVCGWPIKEMIRDGCTKDVCSMVDREGKRADEPRRFHESHGARAALLEWLEGQGNGYLKDEFIEHLAKIVGLSSLYQFDNFDLFKLMLATPAQVAEAALKVIQEGE